MKTKNGNKPPIIKVLNLYAGIGGNRKLWPNDKIDVTAVEIDQKIADIYSHFFPNDKVIVGDAHQHLLNHFQEFDFIWSSPPCPTHSRFQFIQPKKKYPDMKLYEEIILLKSWFKGHFCVENVITYYDPLIVPIMCDNHYFWANFNIMPLKNTPRNVRRQNSFVLEDEFGFDFSGTGIEPKLKEQVLINAVKPRLGLYIFNAAFKDKQKGVMHYVK